MAAWELALAQEPVSKQAPGLDRVQELTLAQEPVSKQAQGLDQVQERKSATTEAQVQGPGQVPALTVGLTPASSTPSILVVP